MDPLSEIVGRSAAIGALRRTVAATLQRQAASRRLAPILIHGETGTGKTLLARAIHRSGPRRAGRFVEVNCAAIPETLLEAELFGFERGAFTDARHAKPGLLQSAQGGTAFLDEIGLSPLAVQGKLLTAIDDRAVRRLGSTRSEQLDIAIVTATSVDLHEAVTQGRFREDLYHRLAVVTFTMPPLRERGDDVVLLAEQFLARACADYGLPPRSMDADARRALLAYPWPGNIRELANVMERVALLTDAPRVTAAALALPRGRDTVVRAASPGSLKQALQSHLAEALERTDWNISRAAKLLGVSRNTVRAHLDRAGLRPGSAPRRATSSDRGERQRAIEPPPPAPVVIRWLSRRVTLLRVVIPSHEEARGGARVVDECVAKIAAFGGRLEGISPFGVIAAFGAEPSEDAPRRAAHAAIAVLTAVQRLDPEIGLKLAIHADDMLVRNAAGTVTIDADATRAALATLDHLLASVPPRAVGVSPSTAPHLSREFDLKAESGGTQSLYLLRGRRADRDAGPVFVGRAGDLRLLTGRLATALGGHGQVVVVAGEPGIGKSRLVAEFRRLIPEGVRCVEGRCVSYGDTVPFVPAIDVVRSACRIFDGDTADEVEAKVRASLDALGIPHAQAAPYLLHLLGVQAGTQAVAEQSPETIHERTVGILRAMSLTSARLRPLVVVIEDLHWIDEPSATYLTSVIDAIARVPMLIVVTLREGPRPPWMTRSYVTQLALAPLGHADAAALVRAAAPRPLPNAVVDAIIARAEGNAFFLEELARDVAAGAEPRRRAVIPATVHDALRARIDRLPSDARETLGTAAVVGRQFSLALLREVTPDVADVDRRVATLVEREFLDHAVPGPEPAYLFRHALTHEVAYEMVAADTRRVLHAASGRALEALRGPRVDEVAETLAYHYSRGDAADKAAHALARCADKAARSYATLEAMRLLDEARAQAERLPDGPDRDRLAIGLLHRWAFCASLRGGFRDVLKALEEMTPTVDRLGDPTLIGQHEVWRGRTYGVLGERGRAVACARRALDEARRAGDVETCGKAHYVLGYERYWSGQPSEGVAHAREAVAYLEPTRERYWTGLAHWIAAINLGLLGRFEEALAAIDEMLAIADETADPRLESTGWYIAGCLYALLGRTEDGIAACQHAVACAPTPVNAALAFGFLGGAYLEAGDAERAIPFLEHAIGEIGDFHVRQTQGWFMALLGEAYRRRGDLDHARRFTEQGLALTTETDYPWGRGWAERTLAHLHAAAGATADAARYFDASARTFEGIGARHELERTRRDAAAWPSAP